MSLMTRSFLLLSLLGLTVATTTSVYSTTISSSNSDHTIAEVGNTVTVTVLSSTEITAACAYDYTPATRVAIVYGVTSTPSSGNYSTTFTFTVASQSSLKYQVFPLCFTDANGNHIISGKTSGSDVTFYAYPPAVAITANGLSLGTGARFSDSTVTFTFTWSEVVTFTSAKITHNCDGTTLFGTTANSKVFTFECEVTNFDTEVTISVGAGQVTFHTLDNAATSIVVTVLANSGNHYWGDICKCTNSLRCSCDFTVPYPAGFFGPDLKLRSELVTPTGVADDSFISVSYSGPMDASSCFQIPTKSTCASATLDEQNLPFVDGASSGSATMTVSINLGSAICDRSVASASDITVLLKLQVLIPFSGSKKTQQTALTETKKTSVAKTGLSLSLLGGTSSEGLLLIGTDKLVQIADGTFDAMFAKSACKDLGFTHGGFIMTPGSYVSAVSTHKIGYALTDFNCDGTETDLGDCLNVCVTAGSVTYDSNSHKLVALSCWTAEYSCTSDLSALASSSTTFSRADSVAGTGDELTDEITFNRLGTSSIEDTLVDIGGDVVETAVSWALSPGNTAWSRKTTADSDWEDYTGFATAVCGGRSCDYIAGKTRAMVAMSATEIRYYDVTFTAWTGDSATAGFSYTRKLMKVCGADLSSYSVSRTASASPSLSTQLSPSAAPSPSDKPESEFVVTFTMSLVGVTCSVVTDDTTAALEEAIATALDLKNNQVTLTSDCARKSNARFSGQITADDSSSALAVRTAMNYIATDADFIAAAFEAFGVTGSVISVTNIEVATPPDSGFVPSALVALLIAVVATWV